MFTCVRLVGLEVEAAEEDVAVVDMAVVVVVLEVSPETAVAGKLELGSPVSVLVFPNIQSPSTSSMLPCSNSHSIASMTFLGIGINLNTPIQNAV